MILAFKGSRGGLMANSLQIDTGTLAARQSPGIGLKPMPCSQWQIGLSRDKIGTG
jgi:hypothetical protein